MNDIKRQLLLLVSLMVFLSSVTVFLVDTTAEVGGLVLSYQGPVNLVLTLEYVLPALGTALIAITGLYLATGLKNTV
ncbi:hypothetical protein HRED_03334 [Candidatus Haloredivivus sp. G17]|nr:hypothetical protein HRED_03334 [Candidatus Haloredivivus sp. G17]